MARTTLATQADEAGETPAPTPAPQPAPPQVVLSMARIGMIMRIITLAFLILSVSLLASNSTTIRLDDNSTTTIHFNDIYAYRYALASGVIGLCYTFLHLLSSVQQVRSGMPFLNHPKSLMYDFLGDKVILALVATGVGAAFGATVDLKAKMDELENAFEVYLGTTDLAPAVSKIDDFFNRAYFPTIFLLMAFLTTGVSSILSSLALTNKTT